MLDKTELDAEPELDIVQPEDVCRVTSFVVWVLTPSIMSISPDDGQLGPKVQNAGHTPQIEPGMCWMSAMKRP